MDENKEIKETKEFKKPRSLFFPLLLVAVGIFLLLTNLGYVKESSWDLLRTYWPLIFVAGGLDSLYRRDGWVGPLVSIGLGTVLVLGNLGYLPWGGWNLLWRLWPVLIIAWGLDVAFGHNRSIWSTVGRVALGFLLVGGILWLSLSSPFNAGIKTETIAQPIGASSPYNISLQNNVGEITLSGDAPEDKLISGTVSIPGNLNLDTYSSDPDEAAGFYSLSSTGMVVWPTNSEQAPWNLKINSYNPILLTTEMAVGNMVLDLSDTMVEDVNTQMAVGQTYVTFPDSGNVSGDIEGAVGETVLRFHKGTQVVIHYSGGLTAINLDDGFSRSGDEISSDFSGDYKIELNVDQAVGNLTIEWYD
jgi:hypothetical protein